MDSSKKAYNVGIVGFGFIGKVHAFGYHNLAMYYDPVPLETRITHVAASRPESAEKGRKLLGAEHAVTDYREITENPDVDIVHICTPNHLHQEAILSAIRHNKHLYCDKPLVADLRETGAIRQALADYRGTAQMTFQSRFFPAVMRAKQLMDDGFVGEVLEFRCGLLHGGSANPRAPLKWKLSAAAGGGVIADLVSHALDLAHHLAGDYASVLAATKIAYSERPSAADPAVMVPVDAEDCAMLLARMKSGALGYLEGTKLATGSEDELRLEIHGSCGALRFNGMDPHHLEAYDATAPDRPIGGMRGWTRIDTGQRYPEPALGFPSPKNTMGWIRVHVACLANFLQDVAAGRPGNPGLEQGIYIQHLMDCTRRSAAENRWIEV